VRDSCPPFTPGPFLTAGCPLDLPVVRRSLASLDPSDPHSITDCLADPDVARPIGRVMAGKDPW
jgi:hypothetical protein